MLTRASLCGLAMSVFAASAPGHEPVRYDGQKLVEVDLTNEAARDRMLAISDAFLSCELHRGPTPFRLTPEQVAALETSGLTFRVLHDNIQELVERERATLSFPQDGDDWFAQYKTYDEVNAYIDTLVATYPALASKLNLGLSLENRTVYGLQITGSNGTAGKPALLFEGCQHAREWVAVMVPMYIADRLLADYGVDAAITELMDNAVFFIVPIVNPDGYEYSVDVDRFWRKNRRPNGGNSFGVDLNRNWGYQWGLSSGSSSDPNSETYRGTATFSEPETTLMRDFTLAHPEIRAFIDFHSYSQLILSPWSYTEQNLSEPDLTIFDDLGRAMSEAIAATHGETYGWGPAGQDLYLASGTSKDWFYGDQDMLGWTIELRPASSFPGFELPPAEILPTGQESYAAIQALADYVITLLDIDFPSGRPTRIAPDAATPITVSIADVNGTYLAGSGKLLARVGGAGEYVESALTDLGGGVFEGALPAGACGELVEYYVVAQTVEGATATSPRSAPTDVYAAGIVEITPVLEDDAEIDRGWTLSWAGDNATTGLWNRMDPQGTVINDVQIQPEDDRSPGGAACFATDGNAGGNPNALDVDGGTTTLVSPVLDLSGGEDAYISYWRWYQNSVGGSSNQDSFVIDISADGGANWVNVEVVGPSGADAAGGWYFHEFRVADHVTPTDQVRVRFVASDLGNSSIVEAAIDDFAAITTACSAPPACEGDVTGDGLRDLSDLGVLLANYGATGVGLSSGDLDGDTDVDLSDLGIMLSVFGQPCP